MPGADRLATALGAIDAANAADPVRIVVDGVERPKELVHADAVERWLRRLDPAPSEAQVLAARAHHLRRWVVPRTDYPEGRAGYLRWRTDHKKRQAAEVREVLVASGYDQATIDEVADLVAKRGLGRVPAAQVHEDALCLTFLELQLDEVAERLGDEKALDVLRRSVAKMSPAGVRLAASIDLSEHGRDLLERAVGG
jgi:hypothetical protein